jgi:2-hydroxy-3-oxopropionate reductase
MRAEIGFIGVGKQGWPMAANLLGAGHKLTVFDINADAAARLAERGAIVAHTPRAAAEQGEIVQICVVDDAQLAAVITGADGVAAALRPGAIVVVHSTVSPGAIDRMADVVAARGAKLVDAPVSGGERGALARTLSFMVGGDADSVARCMPLFETSGAHITHCGVVGMGVRAKLAHQIVLAGNRLAMTEGVRFGLQAGLSPETLQKIVHEGAAQSRIADTWFTRSSGAHARPLYYKDLQLGLAFARELDVALPGAALAQQFIDDIIP